MPSVSTEIPDSASAASPPDASAAPAALRVRGLRKSYGAREVVRGLDLDAARGAITAVLGPNGAGKTTTIECCEGLRRPDAGIIEVLGVDRLAGGTLDRSGSRGSGRAPGRRTAPHAGRAPTHDPAAARALRRRVGVMLQDGGLPKAPAARAVLHHIAALHENPWPPDELLDRLELQDVARTSVRRLSGGQVQRLALACAVVGRPELVFLDEPTAGLDPRARRTVWSLVRELRAAGTSMVLTTHLMDEAEELADQVTVVHQGLVVARGAPAHLCGPGQVVVTLPPGVPPDGAERARAVLADAGVRGSVVPSRAPGARSGRPDSADRGAAAGRAIPDAAGQAGTAQLPAGSAGSEVPTSAPGLSALTAARVGSALAEAGLGQARLTWHRRSLEDVFLELTGASLDPAEER